MLFSWCGKHSGSQEPGRSLRLELLLKGARLASPTLSLTGSRPVILCCWPDRRTLTIVSYQELPMGLETTLPSPPTIPNQEVGANKD